MTQRSWLDDAACKNVHPDVFFPEKGCEEGALKICRQCPVITPCLEMALRNQEQYGVLGGTTETERQRMFGRRTRRAGAIR